MRILPCITRWALNAITCILIKGRQIRQTPAEQKAQYEDRGGDPRNVATNQGMPQPPQAERQGVRSPRQPLEGGSPVSTLIWAQHYGLWTSGLQSC